MNVIRDKRLWCNGIGTHYAHWQVPAGDSRGVHDVIDTHGRAFTSPSGLVVGLVYHLLDRREGGGGPAGFRVYFFTFRVVCIIPCDGMPSSFHPEYLICVRNNHRLRGWGDEGKKGQRGQKEEVRNRKGGRVLMPPKEMYENRTAHRLQTPGEGTMA